MHRIDALLSHVWMVRTFLTHSEEAAEDDDLAEGHRVSYDYRRAFGTAWDAGYAAQLLQRAPRKLAKLRRAIELFLQIQPDVSTHMNFRMAARSLRAAVDEINYLVDPGQ